MNENVYDVVIEATDGLGQTSDGYRASVTRISDGKEMVYLARFRWWLRFWYLNPFHLHHDFKAADKRDARLAYKERTKR